jgi:hypothetical protein
MEEAMFGTIAIIVVVLAAAILTFAATRPNSFRIQRARHLIMAVEGSSVERWYGSP